MIAIVFYDKTLHYAMIRKNSIGTFIFPEKLAIVVFKGKKSYFNKPWENSYLTGGPDE